MQLIGLLVLMVFGSGAALAQQQVKLTNGYWPPIHAESSPHQGMAVHLVTRVFELEGLQVSYGFFPWKRAMVLASSEGWDGTFVWSYTKERAKIFAYSDPLMEINDHVLSLKEKNIVFDGVDSLKSWRTGVTIGYFYGDPFEQLKVSGQVRVQENQTDIDNIHKVLTNKADVFLVSKPVGLYLIRSHFPADIERFHLSKKPLRKAVYHVLFSKKRLGYQELVKTFNQGLTKFKKTDEYQVMFQNMLKGYYDPK